MYWFKITTASPRGQWDKDQYIHRSWAKWDSKLVADNHNQHCDILLNGMICHIFCTAKPLMYIGLLEHHLSALLQLLAYLHLDLTSSFNALGKHNCKTRQETIKFLHLVQLILEVWQRLMWLFPEMENAILMITTLTEDAIFSVN